MERENTIAAFVAAANRPFWGIETDVRLTKDGQFVLSHDRSLLRLTGADVEIAEHTYEELQAYTYCDLSGTPRADLKVPLLSEYLSVCKRYGKIAVVEIKIPLTEENARALLAEVEREYALKKTVFISFLAENLILLRAKFKRQRLQLLADYGGEEEGVDEWLAGLTELAKRYDFGLDLEKSRLTKERVERLRAAGISVNAWTANTPSKAERLVEMGVDYITTETCI